MSGNGNLFFAIIIIMSIFFGVEVTAKIVCCCYDEEQNCNGVDTREYNNCSCENSTAVSVTNVGINSNQSAQNQSDEEQGQFFDRDFVHIFINGDTMVTNKVSGLRYKLVNATFSRNISLYLYYFCNEINSEEGNFDRSVHIQCVCDSVVSRDCCSSGDVIFIPQDYNTDTWECSMVKEDLRNFEHSDVVLYQLPPYVFLRNDILCSEGDCGRSNDLSRWEYYILEGSKAYSKSKSGQVVSNHVDFSVVYLCNNAGYKSVNSTMYQQVICKSILDDEITGGRTPWFTDYYQGMTVLCLTLHSLTLVAFVLLPEVRTMKSKILNSQTCSFLVLNIVNLIFYGYEGHLPKTECIIIAYMTHFWNLVGTFWINVLCIDMAWTFSGTHIQRSDKWKFMAYSIYAWGTSVLITSITAIVEYVDHVPDGIIKPDISLHTCWFRDIKSMLAYHYGPVLLVTLANGPLVVYSVYRITRTLCSTSILNSESSGCHAGSKPKKNKKRFVIYVNLAMMFGTPRLLSFVKLLISDEVISLFVNITAMLRSVFIFLFVCCRPKVINIIKKQASVLSSKLSNIYKTDSQRNTQEMTANRKTSYSNDKETGSSAV